MSEVIVFSAFALIAVTGHHVGEFLHRHNLFDSGRHFPKCFLIMLTALASGPTREIIKDYAIHIVIYSKAGLLSLLGLHT